MTVEVLEQGLGFFLAPAVESQSENLVHIERLAAGLWMGAHYGVKADRFLPLAIVPGLGGAACIAGTARTGYGALRGMDGKRVAKTNPALTKKQGEELLRRDLSVAEKAVHVLVGPNLTPNQFSACVSLVFNIGRDNFRASQIRQRLLREDHEGAADIWWQWRRGGPAKRILPGLVRRREMEKELFLA